MKFENRAVTFRIQSMRLGTEVETLTADHWIDSKERLKSYSNGLRKIAVSLLTLIAILLLAPSATNAQVAGGAITGTVRGENGSAMPGAHISVSDATSGTVRTTTTDSDWLYNAPNLPPGRYDMTISAPGFVTQEWTAVAVIAGVERSINIVMRAGDPAQVVRTLAPSAPVSENSPGVSGNVNASTVRDTPLNGRDWAQLATLQTGVTGVQTGSASEGGNVGRGFGAPTSRQIQVALKLIW